MKHKRTAVISLSLLALACVALPKALSAPGSAKANTGASSFDEGVKLYKAKQYSQAAFKLLDATKTAKGKEASAFYYLACCYFALHKNNEARAVYRSIVSNYPNSREAELASLMLKRLDPSYVTPWGGNTSPSLTSSSTQGGRATQRFSTADSIALQKELAGLPDVVRFPFTTDNQGHMRVTCYLNDRPVEALFDTGASAHFGKNHLKAAQIPEPRGEATGTTSGWAGAEVPVWQMTGTLKIGNLTRRVPVTVEDQMDLLPLVGQEIIKGYQCEVDNGIHYVILRKSKTGSSADQISDLYDVPISTSGSDERARDYVSMEVNYKKVSVLIDTGATNTIFNPKDLKTIGITLPEDAPTTLMSGVGGRVLMKQTTLDLKLGPIRKTGFTVLVGGDAGSAVGQDFLSDRRFTIDRERKLMRFFH